MKFFMPERFTQSAEYIRNNLPCPADCAIIAGSGIGGTLAAEKILRRIPYADIPGFPVPGVVGHSGELLLMEMAGRAILVFGGRFHLYEGHPVEDVIAPVEIVRILGIPSLILTNAAGGLHPNFRAGEIMLLGDIINLTFRTLKTTADRRLSGDLFSAGWTAGIASALTEEGIAFHSGVYAGVTGPNYETPAEIRWLRRIHSDAVGMSTIHEAQYAFMHGIRLCGCSLVTNSLKETATQVVTHEEVLEAAARGERALKGFFYAAIQTL